MKRLLLLALGLLFSAVSMAQTDTRSQAIIDRYNQVTGLSNSASSALMEVQVATAGVSIQMKITKGAESGCFRIEMTVPGQGLVLLVTDGKSGWVATKGAPVQSMPKQVIDQMAAQGDMSGSVSVDLKNFSYTYVGQVKGNEVISGVANSDSKLPIKEVTMSFSPESGLLTSVETKDPKGQSVVISMSDYQKFGAVMMPTRLETTVPGAQNAVVTIKNVEFGIPTEAWMFAKPAALK